MRFATKLTSLFLLLAIIPLVIVGYISFDNGRRAIEQNVFNHLISTNILKGDEFNRWIKKNEAILRDLARRPLLREDTDVLAVRNPSDEEYQAAYRRILEEQLNPALEEEAGFLVLSILRGQDGVILISTEKGLEGKYRESEQFFLEGRNRTFVENVNYSLTDGGLVMHFSTPIRDGGGNLIAVLAGHADLAEISKIMENRSGLSRTEDTYLVNKFNFFVTEPLFGDGYALKKAAYTEGVQACLEHREGVGFYRDYRGEQVIGAYRWISERELCILTEVDQAEAFTPIVALRNAIFGIGLGLALGVALLGLLFARTITGPVRQLVKGAEEIGRGNLEYRIGVASRDEIGQLTRTFNKMTEDLRAVTASRDEVNREITERKRMERDLLESEEKYRLIADNADDWIYLLSPDRSMLYISPSCERVTGYSPAEFTADPDLLSKIVHPDDRGILDQHLAETSGPTGSHSLEFRIVAKSGEFRWLNHSCTAVLDDEGKNAGRRGTNRDITTRKQAEEELKDPLIDLERSNKELEQFAYVASHDLQEPLRMISSFTQLLSQRYKGKLDKDANEFIAYAVDGSTHMQRLINDLLSYSRVGTRGRPPEPVPANAALDRALENLKMAVEESRAVVEREPLPIVAADDMQLTQLFQNLISNGVKFRGKNPPRIRIACEARGNEWVFSVRDNGIGIDPQYLDRIFILFQRLHERGKYPGTGIGLAICKKIVQRHGGRIWVESEPGKGSTFYFSLPKTGGK